MQLEYMYLTRFTCQPSNNVWFSCRLARHIIFIYQFRVCIPISHCLQRLHLSYSIASDIPSYKNPAIINEEKKTEDLHQKFRSIVCNKRVNNHRIIKGSFFHHNMDHSQGTRRTQQPSMQAREKTMDYITLSRYGLQQIICNDHASKSTMNI